MINPSASTAAIGTANKPPLPERGAGGASSRNVRAAFEDDSEDEGAAAPPPAPGSMKKSDALMCFHQGTLRRKRLGVYRAHFFQLSGPVVSAGPCSDAVSPVMRQF